MTTKRDFVTTDPYFITDWTGICSPVKEGIARMYSNIVRAQEPLWKAQVGPNEIGMYVGNQFEQRFWWLQSLN